MPGFLQWVGSSGAWLCSPFAALPSFQAARDVETQEWCTTTSPSVLGDNESGWSRRSESHQSTTGAMDFDSADTQFCADVFTTRSAALRKTVAGARTSVTDTP